MNMGIRSMACVHFLKLKSLLSQWRQKTTTRLKRSPHRLKMLFSQKSRASARDIASSQRWRSASPSAGLSKVVSLKTTCWQLASSEKDVKLYNTMYIVQHIVHCTTHCTLYNTMYIVQHIVHCTTHCTLYNTMYIVQITFL